MINFENLVWLFKQGEESRNIIRLNIAEAAFLYSLCKRMCSCSPQLKKTIVEIGRKQGGSTALLLGCLGPYDQLFSIDIKKHNKLENNLKRINGSTTGLHLIDEKPETIGRDWNEEIDLILINRDYSIHEIQNYIQTWSPHIKNFGFVFFHNIIPIDDLLKSNWKKYARIDSMLCLQKVEK